MAVFTADLATGSMEASGKMHVTHLPGGRERITMNHMHRAASCLHEVVAALMLRHLLQPRRDSDSSRVWRISFVQRLGSYSLIRFLGVVPEAEGADESRVEQSSGAWWTAEEHPVSAWLGTTADFS